VPGPVLGGEQGRLPTQVGLHGRRDAPGVVGVDEPLPGLDLLLQLAQVVAEHGRPAPAELDAPALDVPVPEAVVRTIDDVGETLLRLPQLPLELRELADVGEDDAHRGLRGARDPPLAGQVGVEGRPVALRERQPAGGSLVVLDQVREEPMPAGGVPAGDETGEATPHQALALLAQDRRRGEVRPGDETLGVEGEIPDGREVVEVDVAIVGLLQGELGPPQLLVLHLQLDLVDVQLVEEIR
jgi:hypothetical protein